MAYTPPAITSSGLSTSTYSDILSYLLSSYQSIYGPSVYLGTDSSDYQEISIYALQVSDINNALQQVYNSFNPLTAIGVSLDLLGQLIGTPRKNSYPSTAILSLIGIPGTVINNGVAQDQSGNYWSLPSVVTIGNSGTVDAKATCQVVGSISANAYTIIKIATPVPGWSGVANQYNANVGSYYESDSMYRARLLISNSLPSLTLVAGTAAGLANVIGVTRSQVYENPTGTVDSNGLPAHSICCVVEGGDSQLIAQAIYNNKGIGCATYGSTTISVTDPNNGGLSQNINFIVLGYVPVYVAYNVHILSGYTSDTTTAIINGCLSYLNELNIGEDVLFSQLFAATQQAAGSPVSPLFAIRSIVYGYLSVSRTATVTSGSPTIVVSSNVGISNGQIAVGNGIPPNTTVTGVVGTSITLSANATINGSGVNVSFFNLVSAGSDVSIGFSQAAQGISGNVIVNLVS